MNPGVSIWAGVNGRLDALAGQARGHMTSPVLPEKCGEKV